MMDVKPLVVIDNKTKNGVKNAIEILVKEVQNIREQKQKASKNEDIQVGYTSQMLSHILSIQHLKEVLNEANKVNK